jgi:hypothetical protein
VRRCEVEKIRQWERGSLGDGDKRQWERRPKRVHEIGGRGHQYRGFALPGTNVPLLVLEFFYIQY